MFVFFPLVAKPIKEVEINVGNVAVSCFALLDELGKKKTIIKPVLVVFFHSNKHPEKGNNKTFSPRENTTDVN